MKPKIVSLKALQVRNAAPPSETDFVFLEAYCNKPVEAKKETEAQAIEMPVLTPSSKGFFGWLKAIFGK